MALGSATAVDRKRSGVRQPGDDGTGRCAGRRFMRRPDVRSLSEPCRAEAVSPRRGDAHARPHTLW